MKQLKFWLGNARSGSLVQSLMPALVAVLLCLDAPAFSLPLALLALLGVAAAHLAFNLLDDYFDYRSHQTGYRDTLARAGFRAYTAKCPYLTDGTATLSQLRRAILAFTLLSLSCGGVILAFRGLPVLGLIALTAFLGVFYSAPPLRLSYHGLGEPVIGLIFGPLNMLGVCLACCGEIRGQLALAGLVFGLLVTNILYSHSVLDYAADQSVDKQTFAALFPGPRGRLACSFALIFSPFLITLSAVFLRRLDPLYLLCLLCLPLSVELYRSMRAFHIDPSAPAPWKAWYGRPALPWDQVQASGLDWFLQRWLLSRNLVAATAVCWSLAAILTKVIR